MMVQNVFFNVRLQTILSDIIYADLRVADGDLQTLEFVTMIRAD